MTIQSHQLNDTFVVIDPQLQTHLKTVNETLYQELDQEFNGFKQHTLVSCHSFNQDWPTWENHPAGDEIVYLVSGEAKLLLKVDGEEQSITLKKPGYYVVIPKNTWHTARVNSACTMLFITPGEATLNQEQPE